MNSQGETRHFRNLVVWQKSQEFAVAIISLVRRLNRDRSASVIGNQLVRSAGSVPANIAEGFGRFSTAAYRNHLSIARGSLFESESWLDLLARTGRLTPGELDELQAKCDELARMLTSLMRSVGSVNKTYAKEARARYEV